MNYMDATMLHIGNVPQFFFDNVIIEQIQDITRIIHRPAKQPEPVIRRDKPWEQNPYFTVNGWSVVRDSKAGEFRCWYDDWSPNTAEVKRLGYLYCNPGRTSFATSADGHQWYKPELDYLVEKSQHTNVVLGNLDVIKLESTAVFEDPLETDPQRRYKMFLDRYVVGRNAPQQQALSPELSQEVMRTRDGRDGGRHPV